MRPFRLFPFVLIAAAAFSLLLACGGGGGSDKGTTYYADADGDGFGDVNVSQVMDSAQAGWVLDSTDCDDTVGSGASIHPGASEICDGEDNDCDPLTDDGADAAWLGSTCDGTDSDLCEEGTYSCTGGLQVCSDATGDDLDLCDGVDNDCNGATADGADEATLGTSCDGTDADLCEEGTLECSGGLMTCNDLTGSNVETCNGLDDDCDGETDEASPGVPLRQECYTGPPVTRNVGLCTDGTQTCSGGVWGGCADEVVPATEICDGQDNNCDSTTDESFPEQGQPCTVSGEQGTCAQSTYSSCSAGILVCPQTVFPVSETCNGLDDDCDGQADNGLIEPLCPEQDGVCAGSRQTCGGGSGWQGCDAGNYGPDYQLTESTCDDLDNDCDGIVDDDYVDGTVTFTDWDGSLLVKNDSCGTGACSGGTVVCGGDQTSLECSTGVNASAEVCNGLDDDCDGEIDEGLFCPASGILDDTFSADGIVVFDGADYGGSSLRNDYGFGVAAGMSGEIFVAGNFDGNQNDMTVWRYTSSGVLDSTFGPDVHLADGVADGFVVYDRGSYDTGYAAAQDASGRVYLAGHTHGGASNYDMTLLRYNDAGVLDTSFGSNGVVMHDSAAGGGDADSGVAMTLDLAGRIYVAGYSLDGSAVSYMTLWRYTSSGVLDTTFGGDVNPADGTPDGFVIYNGGGGNYYGQAVASDPATGGVYVAGYRNAATQDMVLLCFDSAGVLDTTFDGDGILTFDGATAGDDAAGLAVAVDTSGRIYAAGSNQADSILWRFNDDGTLDTTFGGDTSPADGTPDGFVLHDNAAGGGGIDEARAIALDPLGLVYVTGNSQGANEDMVLWRYTASGVLDTTFGGDVNPSDGTPDGFVVQSGTAGGNGVDRGTSVAVGIVDSEKVYVSGYSHNGVNFDMILWRFK